MASNRNNDPLREDKEEIGQISPSINPFSGHSMLFPTAPHIKVIYFVKISLTNQIGFFLNKFILLRFSRGMRKKPPHALELAAIRGRKGKIIQSVIFPNNETLVPILLVFAHLCPTLTDII